MESIADILQTWIQEREKDVINTYNRKGLKASGKFEREIRHEISSRRGTIYAPPHTGVMLTGRIPNRDQSPDALKKWVGWAGSTFLADWVKDKGLSLNSYAVAWKIAKEGITVPNENNDGRLLEDSITQDDLDTLKKQLGRLLSQEITSNYRTSWQR